MLKVILENARDLKFFLQLEGSKCYALLNEGIIFFSEKNIKNYYSSVTKCYDAVIDRIKLFCISATVEYIEDKNFFIDVYLDGKVRESNSLTHINTKEDLSMHLDG